MYIGRVRHLTIKSFKCFKKLLQWQQVVTVLAFQLRFELTLFHLHDSDAPTNDQFIHEIRNFLHSWGEIIPQLDCIMELLWSRFDPDRCQGIKDWLINSITEYVIGINIETFGGLDWDWFFWQESFIAEKSDLCFAFNFSFVRL